MGMGRRHSHADLPLYAHLGGRENIRFMEAMKAYGRGQTWNSSTSTGNRSVNVGFASIGMTRRMRRSVRVRHALDSGSMSRG